MKNLVNRQYILIIVCSCLFGWIEAMEAPVAGYSMDRCTQIKSEFVGLGESLLKDMADWFKKPIADIRKLDRDEQKRLYEIYVFQYNQNTAVETGGVIFNKKRATFLKPLPAPMCVQFFAKYSIVLKRVFYENQISLLHSAN